MDDLLLSLVHHATERGEQNVPSLEQEGHVRRRKPASFRCRRMKSSGRNAMILRQANIVFYGVLASAEYFDPTGLFAGFFDGLFASTRWARLAGFGFVLGGAIFGG
ncbi:MAG TPA: hypothetical protein EYQ63_18095 [Fuerstia sp.]|nr:hypothetical protein [Fuerstiella sp.]